MVTPATEIQDSSTEVLQGLLPLDASAGDQPLVSVPSPGLEPLAEEPVAEEPRAPEPTAATKDLGLQPTLEPQAPKTPAQPSISDLQQQISTLQAQDMARQLENEAMSVMHRYQQGGMDEQAAQGAAMQWLEGRVKEIGTQQQTQAQAANNQGQRNAAFQFARQYGLDIDGVELLMQINNPEQMERRASELKELYELRTNRTEAAKAAVPPQRYDTNQGGAVASDQTFLQRMGDEGYDPTPADFARLAKLKPEFLRR